MANPEHLAVLKQVVEAWNHWRTRNPGIRPDLSEAILIGADLEGINWGMIATAPLQDLQSAQRENEHEALVKQIVAWGVAKAVISKFEVMRDPVAVNLYHADFSDANLAHASLQFADLTWPHLARTSLRGANLEGARLWFPQFYNRELKDANFRGASIGWAKFVNVNLGAARGIEEAKHDRPSSVGIDPA